MFDKFAPVPITNPAHRSLLIFSMTWFLIGTSLIAGSYGLLFVFYLFTASFYFEQEMVWRFYGLGGLVTIPLLFGYMIGGLGVSPVTREIINN
jgi:hypothetical protein